MEFPRHLHKPGGLYVVPENAGEYEQLKARGWLDLPPAHVEQPTPVLMHVALNEPVNATPIDVDEAEPADDPEQPKRRGRKPKDE